MNAREWPKIGKVAQVLGLVLVVAVAGHVIYRNWPHGCSYSKVSGARTEISMIGTGLESFKVDTGRYPTTAEGLKALVEAPANCPNWNKEGYLPTGLPSDPWGNPYAYRCPGLHNAAGFDVFSFGPDGNEGGGDDVDNWSEK
jgi:general secretion pathway protein G